LLAALWSSAQTVPVQEVKNHVGETITVLGKVVDGRFLSSSSRKPTLLNIDKPYPNQTLTIVIYGNNRALFGYKPEEALRNKNVFVTGKVTIYNGKPQIEVEKPDQIVITTANAAAGGKVLSDEAIQGEIQLKTTVKLRSGPGNSYKVITKLKPGSIIQVLHNDAVWTYVSVRKVEGKSEADYTLVGFIKTDELK